MRTRARVLKSAARRGEVSAAPFQGRATCRRPKGLHYESSEYEYCDDPRTHSELQLQAELHLARRTRVGDLSVAAAAQIGVRVREVDAVQRVEHIRPQP